LFELKKRFHFTDAVVLSRSLRNKNVLGFIFVFENRFETTFTFTGRRAYLSFSREITETGGQRSIDLL